MFSTSMLADSMACPRLPIVPSLQRAVFVEWLYTRAVTGIDDAPALVVAVTVTISLLTPSKIQMGSPTARFTVVFGVTGKDVAAALTPLERRKRLPNREVISCPVVARLYSCGVIYVLGILYLFWQLVEKKHFTNVKGMQVVSLLAGYLLDALNENEEIRHTGAE